ncbi:hypothetical protein CVT25_010551 [Psilocybe cyanescens]|uniref:Uncharacterized protein n=1 Tax=Psilocybe cyanescens TaxID=93625 RepID=A0A409VXK2_PSICY|nr:hypothetical protein CVT25_010551 [Psilocybe cyanescens]
MEKNARPPPPLHPTRIRTQTCTAHPLRTPAPPLTYFRFNNHGNTTLIARVFPFRDSASANEDNGEYRRKGERQFGSAYNAAYCCGTMVVAVNPSSQSGSVFSWESTASLHSLYGCHLHLPTTSSGMLMVCFLPHVWRQGDAREEGQQFNDCWSVSPYYSSSSPLPLPECWLISRHLARHRHRHRLKTSSRFIFLPCLCLPSDDQQ